MSRCVQQSEWLTGVMVATVVQFEAAGEGT